MEEILLTAYVLIWPVLAAAVLLVLCVGVWRDVRRAAARGVSVV
jgi:hypothetical protein